MNDGGIGIGTFIGYLRQKKSLWLIVAVLAFGIILMLFGGDSNRNMTDSIEIHVKELCEQIDGVYDVHVMIVYKNDKDVGGIAVVCDGGDTAAIKLKLTELLSSLFTIPSSAVSVVGGK